MKILILRFIYILFFLKEKTKIKRNLYLNINTKLLQIIYPTYVLNI